MAGPTTYRDPGYGARDPWQIALPRLPGKLLHYACRCIEMQHTSCLFEHGVSGVEVGGPCTKRPLRDHSREFCDDSQCRHGNCIGSWGEAGCREQAAANAEISYGHRS